MLYKDVITTLENHGCKFIEKVDYFADVPDMYSLFFELEKYCLIIDYNICKITNPIFNYAEYTNKQNEYMFKYNQCYRFYVENDEDLDIAIVTFKTLISTDNEIDINYIPKFVERNLSHPDNTPLEDYFEKCFVEVYGSDGLKYLKKNIIFKIYLVIIS